MKKNLFIALVIALTLSACSPKATTADDVISVWKNAGLEAENTRPMTKDDYGMAPFVCEGTRFYIPSLGEDNGGRLFICEDEKDRDALSTYYDELGKKSALFFSWVFTKGNIVVQINGDLPEETALKYQATIP